MKRLQDKYKSNLWRTKTAHGHWKVQQEFQGWKAEMFQLQQVQIYGEGMPVKEEKTGNEKMFQM